MTRIMACMIAPTMSHMVEELKTRILASVTSRSETSTVTMRVTIVVTVAASLRQCQ